jgi:hypothetical protein
MTAAFERTAAEHTSFDFRALRRDWPLLEARGEAKGASAMTQRADVRSDQQPPVKVDELVERRKRQPMRTSCGRCGESFEGTLEKGRSWFAEHRANVHGESSLPVARPPKRSFRVRTRPISSSSFLR